MHATLSRDVLALTNKAANVQRALKDFSYAEVISLALSQIGLKTQHTSKYTVGHKKGAN